MKPNQLCCPKCGLAIEFGPPIYCDKCNATVIPQLMYLARLLKPIEEIEKKYKVLNVTKSKHRPSILEYFENCHNTMSILGQFAKQIGEAFTIHNFFNQTQEDLESRSKQIIDLTEMVFKIYKDYLLINPPKKIMSHDFEEFHEKFIMTFIKSPLEQIFNAYYTIIDQSVNTEKYIKNNRIELRTVFSMDNDALNEITQFISSVTNADPSITKSSNQFEHAANISIVCPYCESQKMVKFSRVYPILEEIHCDNPQCVSQWHQGLSRSCILVVENQDRHGLGKDHPTIYTIRLKTAYGEETLIQFKTLEKHLTMKRGDLIALIFKKKSKGIFSKKWTGEWETDPSGFLNETVHGYWRI